MSYFTSVSTLSGNSLDFPGQAVSFSFKQDSNVSRVVLYDFGYGEAQEFEISANGVALVNQWMLGNATHNIVDVSGYGQANLDKRLFNSDMQDQTSNSHSAVMTALDYNGLGQFSDEASVLIDARGPSAITFVAMSGGQGITSLQINSAGVTQSRSVMNDTDALYLDNISDMEAVTVGQKNFLYATSATEHGLSGFSYSATGILSEVESIGRSESLPVQTMTALASGTSGNSQFLIGAASGSSSLTVMRVENDGSLKVTDHVVDSLDTRFANASQLEAVTHEGRMYLLTSGNDDGISLFTVTGEGRLVHLESLADTVGTSLGGVSGMAAVLREGGIDVLTVAAHEAGMSQFRIELPEDGIVKSGASGTVNGSSGDDMLSLHTGAGRINAGAGNDILSDGGGRDILSGGAGEDIFVLQADGQRDVITDINIAEDRLDLSAWSMLRNVGQLNITSTMDGADIQFGDEEISLQTSTGMSLTEEDVAESLLLGPSHYVVELGALQIAEPEPDIVPAPNPTTSVLSEQALHLIGDAEDNRLEGRGGDDFIKGEAGDDTLYGGAGSDSVIGGSGHDLIYAGDGDDNVPGKAGNDTIYGEDGNDQLGGSDGFDFIYGGAGNDLAGGGNQNDTMDGGSGDDWFSGGWGNDLVMGNSGNDKLAGSYDNDTVVGGAGNDSIGGGMGTDILKGEDGNDVLGAGEGNDILYGGQGNDSLGGADDNDMLYGGSGNDTLNGAHGNDTMEGGSGSDIFFFNNFLSSGQDVIIDFEVGVDQLRLVGVHLGAEGTQLNKLHFIEGVLDEETGTWMDFGQHDIFLVGVEEKALSRDDFSFS